uniref:C-type lectin domain-containing protein n=1 Tax=Poecilia latipinna TaxID=48699 RepID=A0A3B3TRU0_9TELE
KEEKYNKGKQILFIKAKILAGYPSCLQVQVKRGPSKYVVVNTFMFWEDAKNYCRSKHTDLVRVWNTSQNDEIHPLIERNHWIGLYRDLWANWSDHSLLTFTNWETGQPDNKGSTNMTSCAAVDTSTGKWWDVDCSEEHEFICQTLIPSSRRLELRFQSEADLNDPDAQQQILQQVNTVNLMLTYIFFSILRSAFVASSLQPGKRAVQLNH